MSTSPKKIAAKDPSLKLAHKRLTVLQLAQSLGNVTEACRRSGMDRTSFYTWQKRFQEQGLEGLKDLPPIHKTHPQTTPQETVDRLIALSEEHPGWGCIKLSDYLKLEGISVSSPTVQKILIRHQMASRYDRLLRLEERHLKEGLVLSEEQIRLIEKMNPAFRERHVESSSPGELLCQDTKQIGTISGIGRIYLHSVVDTYGSYGFGCIHTNKIPEAAVAVLHNDVLPQYQAWGIPVQAILTDHGREFCGTDAHPYELYLRLNDIEHRTTQVRHPQTNGFVERFHRTVKEEFIVKAFRETLYTSIAQLQTDFDTWLHHYNTERPHRGYRNLGKRPIDTVKKFIKSKPKNARHQD
ncbi:MAG: IS481 family transposase [Methanobacteriota archaeon]|nr:MAG: IS481 family transposase [Euryarchaeota archaeon]